MSAAANAPLLDVRNLRVEIPTRRGALLALDNVSFTVAPGEILGFVGESGAGKSLTGMAVLGLLDPPARIVAVGDSSVLTLPHRVAPGTYTVVVESPRHSGFAGTLQEMRLDIKPCLRYYINAQFRDPVQPAWTPVVDEVEPIAGCRVGA